MATSACNNSRVWRRTGVLPWLLSEVAQSARLARSATAEGAVRELAGVSAGKSASLRGDWSTSDEGGAGGVESPPCGEDCPPHELGAPRGVSPIEPVTRGDRAPLGDANAERCSPKRPRPLGGRPPDGNGQVEALTGADIGAGTDHARPVSMSWCVCVDSRLPGGASGGRAAKPRGDRAAARSGRVGASLGKGCCFAMALARRWRTDGSADRKESSKASMLASS
jgi:hypothetical protein